MAEEKKTNPASSAPAKDEAVKEEKPAEKPSETKKDATPAKAEQPKQDSPAEAPAKAEEKNDEPFADVKPGAQVRVHQEITDITPKGEEKKRIQIFEGMVLQRKHGKDVNATITVRKESGGIGVEKIFPLHLPTIKKIEVVKTFRTRRAKIGFIRTKHRKLREIK